MDYSLGVGRWTYDREVVGSFHRSTARQDSNRVFTR